MKLFVLVVFCGILISPPCRSQGLLADSIVKELHKGVEGFKDRYHSPSIVLAIVHDKDIIFHEAIGYLDMENKVPATIHSPYSIQSLTKVFTATMFMQLLQRGVVSLDDDVKKYVPEYNVDSGVSGKSGTTLFQLATHTSGLPRNSPADITFTKQVDRWFFGNRSETAIAAATRKEFLRSLAFIRKEYPEYEFLSYGDRHYSNLGYALLGFALERAAGISYSDYVVKNICKPLQMNNSSFYNEDFSLDNTAKGYYYDDSTKDFLKVPIFKPNSVMPAGGMYASASDLAKFISFQFDSNSTVLNNVLSEKYRAMMRTLNIAWKLSYPFVFHEGSMLGYRSEIVLNPELKLGWVILTNTTDFDFSRLNQYISQLLLPVFTKPPITDLMKLTGTYKLDGSYDSLKIYVKDGNLYSTYLQDELPNVPLISSGNNKFKGPGKGSYTIGYEFLPDNKAEIKGLNLGQLMWAKQ
jgi:CubicO group peptidase (beta-lactamase class C family)